MKVKVKIPVGSVKASLLPRSFSPATRLKTLIMVMMVIICHIFFQFLHELHCNCCINQENQKKMFGPKVFM